MSSAATPIPEVLRHSPVRVQAGAGALARLPEAILELGVRRILLVTDAGLVACGHVETALQLLNASGFEVTVFDNADENPTTEHVQRGLGIAERCQPELLIGFGGGSPMDCAKGINILLTNGGEIRDYWGVNKTTTAMLPMIAVPTTAGTGSEAQSFALISDATTHVKMVCGDRRLPEEGGLRPHVAILDHELTATVPRPVRAATGIDAISHVVETSATKTRNEVSRELSRAAWDQIRPHFGRSLIDAEDAEARAAMQIGAHLAGAAIEQSMLGAAHACANPLTARFGTTHGHAVGVMLPHVVRFNCQGDGNPYSDLGMSGEELSAELTDFAAQAGIATRLRDHGVPLEGIPELAENAAKQWTAQHNPREVGADELRQIYEAAW